MRYLTCCGLAMLSLCAASRAADAPKRKLRVYHVGNSLTASLLLDRLQQLFATRGIDYQYGSQISGGMRLAGHWDYKNAAPGKRFGSSESQPFGLYDRALREHPWDVLVLQPYEESLGQTAEACTRFIALAREKSPGVRVVLLAGYPRRFDFQKTGISTVDIHSVWNSPYDHALDDTSHTAVYSWCKRAYFERLRKLLVERFPGVPVSVVSFSETLVGADKAIRGGSLPGLAALAARRPEMLPGWKEGEPRERGANIFYADNFHLNPLPHQEPTLGIYAVALTLFAGLAGESPVGLPGAAYGLDDAKDADLIRALQQIVEQARPPE